MLFSDFSPEILINTYPFIIILKTQYKNLSNRNYSILHLATTFLEACEFANNSKLHNFSKYKIVIKNNNQETEKINLCWNVIFCDNKYTTNSCHIRKTNIRNNFKSCHLK